MIGKSIGWVFATARDALARGLIFLRVTPNSLTIIGTLLTVAAGVVWFSTGSWKRKVIEPEAEETIPGPAPRIEVEG